VGVDVDEGRITMIRDQRWKYVHVLGYRDMLFDLDEDPDELVDLGGCEDAETRAVLARFHKAHQAWASSYTRTTYSREQALPRRKPSDTVLIGCWDEAAFEEIHGRAFEKIDGRY